MVPYSVLVEVAASLRRRTGSVSIAEVSKKELQNIDSIFFLELTENRANEAADIAKETGLKGMDAIVVQIARENVSILVSLDDDIIKKSVNIARAIDVDAFLKIEEMEKDHNKEENDDRF
ncbi:PIN domain-containing protein [Candidatus Uhrbacteria bacterium]|nr:PIN domain-containing protein [Candidatus Uhrbacteria bacterium]